jgi:transcriptional regulator NrdR family protein
MAVNRLGPPCPECNSLTTNVASTHRSADGGFYRQRTCPCCRHSFHTVQPPEHLTAPGQVQWAGRRAVINWLLYRLPTRRQA